MKVYKLYYY